MTPVLQFLLGVAGLLLAGVLSELLFERTKIPDALWLILLGLIIGPILNLVDESFVSFLLEYFAALTLIVILFEGGRRLSITSLRSSVGNAFTLAVTGFLFSMSLVALFSWIGAIPFIGIFENWSWWKALMLGCIIGGSSSIIIMPTFQFAKVKEKLTNLASVESALTDAFCILGAILFLNLAKAGSDTTNFDEPFLMLSQNLGLGLGLGVIGGLVGILFLPFKKGKHAYPITFAGLLLFYVIVTQLDGNGALAILVLAVMLGNAKLIARFMRMGGERKISTDFDILHGQLSFLFKTFFFVLIGFLIRPPFGPIFFGLFLTIILIVARELACKAVFFRSSLNETEQALMRICVPRGLAAGVLATIPLAKGIPGISESLASTVFSVVVFSVIYFSARFAFKNRDPKIRSEIGEEIPIESPPEQSEVDKPPVAPSL